MTIAEKLVIITEKIKAVYNSGRKNEYNRFWDTYQSNGGVCHGLYMFGGYNWNDDIYNPKYPIKVDAFSSMYQATSLTDTKVPIDVTYGTGTNLFFNANKLKNIVKLKVNAANTYNNWFCNCNELENVRFEGTIANSLDIHWSTKLSAESCESIFKCLSANSTGQILTLPAGVQETYNAKYGNGTYAERVMGFPNWEIKLA